MKCEHCGCNLQIEDSFCPYCGQPNPFAVRHQKEMQHFSREFQKTKQDVLEKSSRFNRRTVRITITAVLIAACAVMAFLCASADDIRYMQIEKRIAAEAQQYKAEINELMEKRDYTGLYNYMEHNQLSYSRALREYDAVYLTSMQYTRLYENLMILLSKEHNEEVYKYYQKEELIESIAREIGSISEEMEENDYRPEEFTEEKKAYMEDLRDMTGRLLVRYLHITEDEAEQLPSLTQARRSVLLEDAYES